MRKFEISDIYFKKFHIKNDLFCKNSKIGFGSIFCSKNFEIFKETFGKRFQSEKIIFIWVKY